MADPTTNPGETNEWRVEVRLEADEQGLSLGERLRSLDLDDEARKRLGGSVIVTRDGPHVFLYAWHEESAREAERVVRDLMEEDRLAGEVQLMRWHPVAEDWKPADEPLPESESDLAKEEKQRERNAELEAAESGEFAWEVVIHMPDLRSTQAIARELRDRRLPAKRRFRHLLVGASTEEKAKELGQELQNELPKGASVGIRANPEELPTPGFIQLESLKPGVLRDLGL